MNRVKVLMVFLYSFTKCCFVSSMEVPVITRGIYDLIQFPKCNGKTTDSFACGSRSERYGSRSLCQCKCKDGYLAYRDPSINHKSGVYTPKIGARGCVWFSIYREGCHYLHLTQKISVKGIWRPPAPTILDLTTSSSVTLAKQNPFGDNGCFSIDPYVRIPGKNLWKPVNDITFELKSLNGNNDRYSLSWTRDSSDANAYQGLVMKLNFSECGQSKVMCIMTKVAGTYTDESSCEQRTINNRCCIFPFVHNGVVHNECVTTTDMPGGTWCAVSLNTSIDSGNHKWRELCATSSTTPNTQTTKPSSRRPPTIFTPRPTVRKTTQGISLPPTQGKKASTHKTPPSKKGTTRHLRTNPHHPKTPQDKGKITVTVTHHTCQESSKVPPMLPPTVGAREDGGSSVNPGAIVGIVLAVVVLFVVASLLAIYLRCRKAEGRSRATKSMSVENLADSPYASAYGTPRYTRNHLNHGYQQSIELPEDKAAVIRRGYLRNSGSSGTTDHYYDTVENGSGPSTGLSYPIYSIPDADYSLILERKETKIDKDLPPILPIALSGTTNNSSRHLYSVLERDHDPLKNPEPIDNDVVFVEANPLYGTIGRHNASDESENSKGYAEVNPLYGTTTAFRRDQPPPLPPRLYDDPMDLLPEKAEPVGPGEADV